MISDREPEITTGEEAAAVRMCRAGFTSGVADRPRIRTPTAPAPNRVTDRPTTTNALPVRPISPLLRRGRPAGSNRRAGRDPALAGPLPFRSLLRLLLRPHCRCTDACG